MPAFPRDRQSEEYLVNLNTLIIQRSHTISTKGGKQVFSKRRQPKTKKEIANLKQ